MSYFAVAGVWTVKRFLIQRVRAITAFWIRWRMWKRLKAIISVAFSQTIEMRQQIEDHLKAAIADNRESLKKLRSVAEKKQLSASKTETACAKKTLEEVLTMAKEEVEKAERFWNSLKSVTVKSVNKMSNVLDNC